jgi:hypothetical protein
MRADNPRIRIRFRPALAAGLAALLALAGCKSGDGGNAAGNKPRDPLVYGPNRIPPQNVPLPDRGGVGVKGPKPDPLLDRPVGKGDKGVSYNDDPARFKGPHVPGPGSTPAALAGKTKDGEELKIDTPDNRVPLQPAGGVVPIAGEVGAGVDALFRDLEKYGVKSQDRTLTREEGKYVFRALVLNANGTKRAYEGVGDNANEAVKQVLDQVVLDRK